MWFYSCTVRSIIFKNGEPEEGTEAWIKWDEKLRHARGRAEVIVAKQRHGPTGTAKLGFQAEFTRFHRYCRG